MYATTAAMGALGNFVSRRRGAIGMRQEDLARRVGISRQSLSVLESGRSVPSTALALRLARALGCRVDDLFWVDDDATISVELAAGDREAEGVPARAKRAASAARSRRARRGEDRVVLASIDGRWVAHRLSTGSPASFLTLADGVMTARPANTVGAAKVTLLGDEAAARQTVLCAGCAPAFGILAARAGRSPGGDHVVWLERSSTAALELLARRQVHVAGAHLYDDATREFNVPFVRRQFAERPMLVFNLARWEAGLVVAPGNPRRIRGICDLARKNVSFVRRQPGAAAQDLIERLLRREGVDPAVVARAPLTAGGHMEVAQLVSLGLADAGVSLPTMARAHGLDFIALAEERFDLVLSKDASSDPRIVRLLETVSSRTFRRDVESLGGHVARDSGKLIADTAMIA